MNEEVLSNSWKRQGLLLSVFFLLLSIGYYQTYASMVSIWMRSDTFAHGFIILPICLWLIWRIRDQIGATLPQANYLGIPVLLLLGLLWLFANYVGVSAIEQLAATMMIPVLVFTLLGWQSTSVMAFPLLFIMFAVPIGEELTPALIEVTADFTVAMVEMVGIPVYREGTFFQLPTGNWSVVAACSGVRYLIASITLGVLYAYLNYQSLSKRLLFIVAACLIPILANGLRAFMIVMIGHFSDMQLATGVDHLIYGWVFFGIVIFIMFYVGSFWRDDDDNAQLGVVNFTRGNLTNNELPHKMVMVIAGLALIVWPIKFQLEQKVLDFSHVSEIQISAPDEWVEGGLDSSVWKPAYHGFDREFASTFKNSDGNKIDLYIGYYAQQRQDAELANHNNVLVAEDDESWRVIHGQGLVLPGGDVNMASAILKNGLDQYVTAYLFYVDGQWSTNKYQTKWLQAKARLLGRSDDGAIVVFTAKQDESEAETTELLKSFASVILEKTKASLDIVQ